ncbi:zinc carboxypeptidase-like [Anoplophora glabripennis]|uniref:zinc carboxypeptidase-like n=1 Tax=Anoplophora glabripennis TaxID=217634 RepID=UPI000C764D8D|nr:zinc carboxypeptidase-like [Anoplophora glabripennis]
MASIEIKSFLIFLSYLAVPSCFSYKVRYDNYKLFRVTPSSPQAVEALREFEQADSPEYNFWSATGPVGKPVEIMVSPNKVSELQHIAESMGMPSKVMADNVQERIDAEERPRTRNGFGWTRYNTLDEINNWLRSLPKLYPSAVSLIELNGTYEGRTILGVKVSYGTSKRKKSVFVESNIHAREWISSATTTYILNQLLTSTNSSLRKLAEDHIWYFFPVFNPDGFEYSHTTDRMWRKTRVPHNILCTGADPNRNWDNFWNVSGGSSDSPCSELYRGPKPFSEPCTKTLSEFIKTVGSELVAYISFHSFSQVLLIPYGHTFEHLDNYDRIYYIGLKAADALFERYGTLYKVGLINDVMYKATGVSADWVKGVFKTPIVLTYELRDTGVYGFQLPPELIIPTCEETLDSFVVIFEEYYKTIKA